MKVLITGFEPFMNLKRNPSLEVLPLLQEEAKFLQVKTLVLPVVFDQVFESVKEAIDLFQPDAILHLGLAENRSKISLERVAINLKDARAKDNQGNQPIDEPILKGKKNAYFSSLPLRAMEAALKAEGIPVEISNSAGTYVCNNIMYHTLAYLEDMRLDVQAGFVHLPLMKEQAEDHPSAMDLDKIKEAILHLLLVLEQKS